MVLQKRLDYGFNGYQVPAIPRASRSARGRRGSFRQKVEDKQMCAFELLATVAGKLLQEKESSSDSSNASPGRSQQAIVKDNVKQEQQYEEKVFKVEPNEQGSSDETVLVSELESQGHNQSYSSKDFPIAQNDVSVGLSSDIDNADQSEKAGCAKTSTANNRNELGKFLKVERDSPGYGQSCEVRVVDRIGRQLEARSHKIGNLINGTVRDTFCSEDLMELDNKPPALVGSDSSIEVPKCKDNHIPRGSFPGFRDDEKVVSRDDDENSSGCTQPSTRNMKAFRPSPRLGDRRIRKLLASKYWKVAPKLKDREHSRTDMKLIFHNRKTCYTRQRSQRNSPFKRRKLFGQSSVLTSEGGISNVGISKSPEKGVDGDPAGAASRASSSVSGKKSSFQSRDSHVKLSIKSFRVPELFIEIPETATVGSLKRTVMEAVTAILGGGLRVGVVLKGNKVRDDNKTLVQTGISNDEKLDNLGFTLEPNPTHAPPPMHPEDPSFPVPCDTPHPVTRYPTTPALDSGMSDTSLYPPMTDLGNFIESDHDSVPSPTDSSADKTSQDSRALVAIPTMSMDALAVVPLHRKPRRSELVQRRIRRPFSVSEVEALVQAVEKLGTGRWRDVKLRAFDNAKHRTYVDLKDKWKTLVHTARISPQQRRGEPVPQELLDRVLSAHAYWSQQQAKQQVKQQNETCLLL
ncbi:SANT/Myb domain [Macleaya cordata]|uniref:SANT/Myb domain n=1 Tax=Macleaya cordata TaxID=56857 RepID=A0A200R1H5_MACCD|nr:SANT/Myb domain [Macleaya cordata]